MNQTGTKLETGNTANRRGKLWKTLSSLPTSPIQFITSLNVSSTGIKEDFSPLKKGWGGSKFNGEVLKHSLSPIAYRLSPSAHPLSPIAYRLSPSAHPLSPIAYRPAPSAHPLSPIAYRPAPSAHPLSPIAYRPSPHLSLALFILLGILAIPTSATAQSTSQVVVVNSNQDGAIQPDDALTLREAIEIVNGELSVEQLSEAERVQVEPLDANAPSRIEFNLPPEQTTIQLQSQLPALETPGLVVDGTTQPGYDASRSATAEIAIPIPVVAIAPAPNQEILRGLTIVGDRITVRGLSLYGFKELRGATLSTPPADIFIAHRLPPPNTTQQQPPNAEAPFSPDDVPPKAVVIEENWLGIPPDESVPETPSAFGVSVFNSEGTTIRRNRIANHEGSGIITSVLASNLQVSENIIVGNGIAGMPDGIRLEGNITDSEITGNLICGNDGSGVYLFKPEGAVQIRDNQITFNGRRLRRAAVYLMGNNHQVTGNQIYYQTGPGVVITAYPKSSGNLIESNRFAGLEGLSIDLNTQQNVNPVDFQRGDGPNPPRNSPNRRKETGNSAINAPQFLNREFYRLNSQVEVLGKADPGSSVEIYRVNETTDLANGPLSEPIATVPTNEAGEFRATFNNLQPGDQLSAIATHPEYGTSEPALNTLIQSPTSAVTSNSSPPTLPTPQCTTRPEPPAPPQAQTPEEPQPVVLRVPRLIHFALDQATISPASAAILDQIADVLQMYPFLTIEIEGHTDPRASNAYNQELGNRRALAARNYLLRRGVAPERLTIRSFGESQRRTTGSEVLDYARDRRAEFIFQDTRGLEIIFEEQETDLQPESRGGSR